MTEQELSEKIVKILIEYQDWFIEEDYKRDILKVDYGQIADVLIAAGIGDVSEWKDRAKLAERVIANILCADACYFCNEKYGDCNVQHRDYGSKECVDRLLMLTKEDL